MNLITWSMGYLWVRSSHLSDGPWRKYVGPRLFHVALLVLAGPRAAVLTEASCLGYIHPAVLTQSLATIWQLGQRGSWMGHYNVSVHRGNTYSNRNIVCSQRVAHICLRSRENHFNMNSSYFSMILFSDLLLLLLMLVTVNANSISMLNSRLDFSIVLISTIHSNIQYNQYCRIQSHTTGLLHKYQHISYLVL